MNQTFGCHKCTQTFNTKEGLIAHLKSHGIGTPVKQAEPIEIKPVQTQKPREIKLTYVYAGQCDACGQQVTTVELDVIKKHYCIAMCTRCNKQLATKEVEKL
jgi:hypothetical protein